ncbi:MAG TPA: extensin family protein, partial [Kofleriaceae bacterium]|nr:extensin family protein [Kofleriaceae bacterium]
GMTLDIGGEPDHVEITAGDRVLGNADDAGALTAQFGSLGPLTLTATAFDKAGMPAATATVDVTIDDPQVADCKAWLDLYKLDYTSGPTNLGITDPVTVTLPLNGVAYRYSGNTTDRKTLYGDCTLMKSLAQAAPILRAHDVTKLVDIGIYNYRCIDQSLTPPNCSMSQHSYAKAIDIAELVTSADVHYSVLKDWVIDSGGTTCAAATENEKDAFLHQVICELKTAMVWNIVLTPNYNSDHRNHFHVDLTKNSDFIKRTSSELVEPIVDGAFAD